jgi:hypothetical protein
MNRSAARRQNRRILGDMQDLGKVRFSGPICDTCPVPRIRPRSKQSSSHHGRAAGLGIGRRGLAKVPARVATPDAISELTKILAELVKTAKRPTTDYLRGDGEASDYLSFADPQGRTFRAWADSNFLPFALVGKVRIYRKSDIDRLWVKLAQNLPLHQRTAA